MTMKFTFDWLKEHLDTDASLDVITNQLSMLGLEVEAVEDPGEALSPFVIGYVKEIRQHPNADRLQLCVVNAGGDDVLVVCGAPNARAGIKGVFAPSGTYVPGTGIELKQARIRGEESNGMLCSEKEMGLSDDHDGIIELPDDAPVGENWAHWAGLDDPIIDIALTPNRGDCASVRGIARDLAAAGLGKLKPLDTEEVTGSFSSTIKWLREFPDEEGNACPFVVGRSFRGVKNGPSPKWLQDRLRAIGLRPISALVDITNWSTFDLGRPLHVFDADKLSGDLTMRFAQAGESIAALDEQNYMLDDRMIVIADNAGVQGIGGVMGASSSGCSEATTNVFLEVALFDPIRISQTGRKLGIMSDARYRFERGSDPTSALWGAEIATRLFLELCGGEASELVSSGEMPNWQRSCELRSSRVYSLGGVEVPISSSQAILNKLGFNARIAEETIYCEVPPWRPDIDGEADLVEEVLRIYGYDKIPSAGAARDGVVPDPVRNSYQQRAEAARRALAARGLVEAVTYSFMEAKKANLFGGVTDSVRLVNPISADLDVMRPSILPNLVAAVASNQARGIKNPALFELGPHYNDDTPEGQVLVAAGVRAGESGPRNWVDSLRTVAALDGKADALAALHAAEAPTDNLRLTSDAPAWYHPGRSARASLGSHVLAQFGELHPRICREMGAEGPVAAFEVFLDNVPRGRGKGGKAKPLLAMSSLQPVHRDLAFVVDERVAAGDVLRTIRSVDRELIVEVDLFDVYRGKGIEAGKKSFALAITLQPFKATMTDAEIEAIADKIVVAVKKKNGGELRG